MLQNPSGRLKDQLCTGSDAQRWVGTVGLAVAVGIAYFLTAQLGRTLLTNSEGLAVFWLGSGVAVGVLVVLGGGARVAVVAGVISASLAINLLGGTSILGAFAFAICNASEAVLAAWLIERWSGPTFRVGKLRHVMALFVAAGVAPAVASAGAAVAMTLLGPSDAPLLSIWRVWFAADALGIVSTAPLLIGVGAVLRDAPPWRDLLEGTLAVLVIAVTNAVALALLAGPWSLITPASFLVPPLLWLGSRYRPEFAAVAAFAIAVTIVWTTTHAIGRYGDLSQPIDIRIVAAQISMLGIALAALGLASLFAERRQNEQALSESMQRLQLALDATELGVWSVDLTTGSVEIDSRGRLLHGFDTNTRPLTIEEARRVVHPNDLPNLNAMFGATQLAGAVHSCEYRVVLPTSHPHAGEVRCVAVMGRIGEDGTRWNGIVRDITESKPAEEAIKQSEARLQEALTAGEVMAFEWNLRTGLSQRSENTSQILGAGLRPDANDFMARVHPEDWAHFQAHVYGVCPDRPSYSARFRFIRPDGGEVWLEETAKAEFDAEGNCVRVKGLTRDITRRKQGEERRNLLLAELDHRVKNVLARVAAVVMHTRRRCGTMDEFVKALHGRIQSMAAAHALLSESRWSGVGLTDLIRHQLAPYTTDANTSMNGPEVMLTSAETQAVSMVIHELVTNAAKHGALSSPDGRVSVSWDRAGPDAEAILTITWCELGGPPIATPAQSGYGSSLIRDLIPHELGGAVDLAFQSDGACCKIEIPLGRR